MLDNYIAGINKAMRASAREAGCVPRKMFKPKKYWCPMLSQLRYRKRFWFMVWNQCDRPKNGIVYDGYKGVKKVFQRTSRQYIQRQEQARFFKVKLSICLA